jgi:hypothetical protein
MLYADFAQTIAKNEGVKVDVFSKMFVDNRHTKLKNSHQKNLNFDSFVLRDGITKFNM